MGGRYPIMMFLLVQTVNSLLLLLLTSMPAQSNGALSPVQGAGLLMSGAGALLIRNVILYVLFLRSNKDMIARLDAIWRGSAAAGDRQEILAWGQASSAAKRFSVSHLFGLIVLVLLPVTVYGVFGLHLTFAQIVHLWLPALAAGIVDFILSTLTLDQWLEPVIQALVPNRFEARLKGLTGLSIRAKLSYSVIGLVMVGLLLTVPTAYNEVNKVFMDRSRSPDQVSAALLAVINAGAGAVVVGVLLSIRLASYFSAPFRKMIDLFQKVEAGDLSRRIDVSYSDEFGKLNIYLNHMIERLEQMTATLEQQVAERTAKLQQVNEQLQVELAERIRAQDQLAYTALHDALTGIPNRLLFLDRLWHVMERARRHKDLTFAVLFMDMDHFKVVNDSLGHNIGDLLLVESARRLVECVRGEDTVARLGGDEFVILLEDLEAQGDFKYIADRIQAAMAAPALLSGQKVFISISMGVVLGPGEYNEPEDLLRDADIAMYRAKKLGRGRYEVFEPSMLESAMSRLELETDLRQALEKEEFVVHYQPIFNLSTRRIEGFEALARWQHPVRGLILPCDFIPVAEETGLVVPMGYWVLDEACRQIRDWQARYPAEPPLAMNVNLSPRQCAEADLVDRIAGTLRKYSLDASCLRLELTESMVVEDSAQTSAMLSRLREMGIQVQIDDFGTGYSSLGYLQTLPINALKIDRTFIGQLGTTGGSAEIVRTILALARSLGMQVIAEGVETDGQLAALQAMDCEYVQGFLFAVPAESREIDALLGMPFGEK